MKVGWPETGHEVQTLSKLCTNFVQTLPNVNSPQAHEHSLDIVWMWTDSGHKLDMNILWTMFGFEDLDMLHNLTIFRARVGEDQKNLI